ncbi:hypothetical protein [Streptomyces sp. NPDC007369]|uniref:hypothetical protein n=1 Tax=Streptomyces sp. NPDC007369 TaxID=3154589 RepID=UPI0033CECE5E
MTIMMAATRNRSTPQDTYTNTCAGAHCSDRTRRPAAGARICPVCHAAAIRTLGFLPDLYEECGRLLAGAATGPRREGSVSRTAPGIPLNTAAVEAREAIIRVLASWSALVADEHAVPAPRREVPDLAAFLAGHLGRLAAHPAVGDLTAELEQLVRRAARVVEPAPAPPVVVGPCLKDGCEGFLAARAQAHVECTDNRAHTWAVREWAVLRRRPLWLGANDIASLWQVPRGTVYRLASEHQWRRDSRAGRTYYHAQDVRRSLAHRT